MELTYPPQALFPLILYDCMKEKFKLRLRLGSWNKMKEHTTEKAQQINKTLLRATMPIKSEHIKARELTLNDFYSF